MSRKSTIGDTKDTVSRSVDTIAAENTNKEVRDKKRNESLTKEMMYGDKAYKRTVTDTIQERDKRYARLHSFGGQTNVEMYWDLGPEAIRDQVFKIKVGDKEAIISVVELQKYTRWV